MRISSIDALLKRDDVQAWIATHGRTAVVRAVRDAAAAVRADASAAVPDGADARVLEHAGAALAARARSTLQPVINASGVILHTNLGRAPLAETAVDRIQTVGTGYASLEFDLAQGTRGRRDVHAESMLCELTGAGAAVAVNNNAAATLLTLTALAAGREVIVSRGELVEIGGGFRVPDVMAQSGAMLREVGTTNRTRVADYAAAINGRTALILRVHPSNFHIEGFTERPGVADLAALARRFDIPLYEDLGSGLLAPDARFPAEPSARDSLAAGASLVSFSGDKLLGGPQAGIIAGTRDLVDRVRRHPLMRALRVDKLTYAALEATLVSHAAGRADEDIPIWRMIAMPVDDLDARARALVAALPSPLRAGIIDGHSAIGGGSAPDVELPTRLVALTHATRSPADLQTALREATPPIIVRVKDDQVLIDLRTVAPAQDEALVETLRML